MRLPTAPFRLRLSALLTAAATVFLLPGCPGVSAYGYAASADGGSSRAGSPTAMFMPAPTQADLSDATLEVPEICALRTNPGDATQGAIGTVTFSSGKAESPPGDRSYLPLAATTIKEVTSSVIDGRPVAVATISCAYGGAYADDAIAVYDSSLSLVASIDPRALRGDLEGHIDDLTIDAVSANAATGDLLLSISQIGVYGDESYHAARHSGSARVLYTWAGGARGYTISDVVYTVGGDKKVRMPRVEDVQAAYDAIANHDDSAASQWMSPGLTSALQEKEALRQTYFEAGSSVQECVLLSSSNSPDGKGVGTVYFSDGRKSELRSQGHAYVFVESNDYQTGDMICALGGARGELGASDYVHRWIALHGKEDGGFEIYNSASYPTC
ncbi:hypothetical protein [Actinomyces israelii]|uniref:hypothetical protein n=1 Tax=Actinomyces israelii TaxID=1659 RepID=UPI002553C373|nr:hypothetical protein [Actinomyces israelii]WKR22366.1 hypothetical protein AIF0345_2315 [Actinomyces israelii]